MPLGESGWIRCKQISTVLDPPVSERRRLALLRSNSFSKFGQPRAMNSSGKRLKMFSA
jgi:hypothetical protein